MNVLKPPQGPSPMPRLTGGSWRIGKLSVLSARLPSNLSRKTMRALPSLSTNLAVDYLMPIAAALFMTPAFAGPYEDCILQNMRGVQAQNAAIAIARACTEKTTPFRCRDAQIKQRIPEPSTNVFDDLPDLPEKKPGKVRPYSGPFDPLNLFVPTRSKLITAERSACLRQCEEASFWSRKFGECRTD